MKIKNKTNPRKEIESRIINENKKRKKNYRKNDL